MLRHKTEQGQALIELAVFGAVVIFLIGLLVRQGVSTTQSENMKLKAMRRAMALSLLSSGKGPSNRSAGLRALADKLLPNSPRQPAARNSGSVLFIEDRLSPEFNKVGTVSRVPIIAQSGATFSNNLFRPLDWGEENSLPITDVYVNGQHISLKTGAFIIKDAPEDGCYWETVPSTSPQFCTKEEECPVDPLADNSECQLTIQQRFDLNRNGDFSDDPPLERYYYMAWQWNAVDKDGVIVDCEDGVFPAYDIDGDFKEEVIYALPGSRAVKDCPAVPEDKIAVLDYQEGDIDYSKQVDEYPSPKIAPGLKQESDIFTLTNNGTYLRIKEGKAYNPETGDFVRNITNKDQVDIVSRLFILSKNTGNVCGWNFQEDGVTPLDRPAPGGGRDSDGNPLSMGDVQTWQDQDVEACGDCFSQTNIGKTCLGEIKYDVEADGVTQTVAVPAIFIRSRIYRKSGKKWFTDFTSDATTGIKRTDNNGI